MLPDNVWLEGNNAAWGQSGFSLFPQRIIINGFAFMTWNGGWPFANYNDWVVTYYPGYPVSNS
jgi:hypothetical protein